MKPQKTSIGEIYPLKTLRQRIHVGRAAVGKLKYEISNSTNGEPVVRSLKTGKWFTPSWRDILDLAAQAGIDK